MPRDPLSCEVNAYLCARKGGWVVASVIARDILRSISATKRALDLGVEAGLFERRYLQATAGGAAGSHATAAYRSVRELCRDDGLGGALADRVRSEC